MNWKKYYEQVLKNICEKEQEDENIVEVDFSKLQGKLVLNENAKPGSLFRFKLNEKATEKDYKIFCELIYNYIGLDIYDYLDQGKRFANFDKKEN